MNPASYQAALPCRYSGQRGAERRKGVVHGGNEDIGIRLGILAVEIKGDATPHGVKIHVGGVPRHLRQVLQRGVPVEIVLSEVGDFNLHWDASQWVRSGASR